MMKAIQKSSKNTNTKTKTMTKTKTKTHTKTKTQKKCLKHPTYAIFLKSWWLTHSKYDDRYLTLVILFTPVTLVTLVTLFRSYNQFYRAECITVSWFFKLALLSQRCGLGKSQSPREKQVGWVGQLTNVTPPLLIHENLGSPMFDQRVLSRFCYTGQ